MEYRDELQIAKKAEKMLTSALQSTAKKTFKEHFLHSTEKTERMRDAVAKAVVKRYKYRLDDVKSIDVKEKFYMRAIKAKMHRAGFVQHYGVDTVREEHNRAYEKTLARVKAHDFKLTATPWIDEAMETSRIRDFISVEISRIRMDEITTYVKQSLEKQNN